MESPGKPSLTLIGLYRVSVDESESRREMEDFYSYLGQLEESAAYRERLIGLVLFEVEIHGADDRFQVGDFTQEGALTERKAWQVAYDESILSSDGSNVAKTGIECADGLRDGRICFYFHHYDPERPMRWTYGEFECPEPVEPRDGILELVRYFPING